MTKEEKILSLLESISQQLDALELNAQTNGRNGAGRRRGIGRRDGIGRQNGFGRRDGTGRGRRDGTGPLCDDLQESRKRI